MAKTTTLEEKPILPYAGRKDTIKIFELIHNRNEPTVIDHSKLKTHNIGSPNHVIAMLKILGLVDDKGVLTSDATDLKGTFEKFKECLESKVKEIYKDLFDTVKDCLNTVYESEVRNYFKNHYTKVKKRMLQIYTNCFFTLRDIINSSGDFKSIKQKESKITKQGVSKPLQKTTKEKSKNSRVKGLGEENSKDIKLTLNLNINLDIGTTKEAIEELFKNILLAHENVFKENN